MEEGAAGTGSPGPPAPDTWRIPVRVRDLGLLTLRLAVGVSLASHGLPKLRGGPGRTPPSWLARAMGTNYPAAWAQSGPANFAAALKTMGMPMPTVGAYASGVAELGGGLAIAAGLASPKANLAVAVNMAVAVRAAHWKTGFYGQGGFEYALLLGSAAVALALTGPGALSLDGVRGRPGG